MVYRIYSPEKINEEVKKRTDNLPHVWGKVTWFSYLLELLDFGFWNFSMSFYFGLYSVILADEDGGSRSRNVSTVLYIYLAVMRGKFFLRLS